MISGDQVKFGAPSGFQGTIFPISLPAPSTSERAMRDGRQAMIIDGRAGVGLPAGV